jgi:double-strand break repair protein AddB
VFEGAGPHLFALPPGADFPQALARGLRKHLQGQPPEAMGRVELFLNSGRMRREVRDALAREGPGLLPRFRLVGSVAAEHPLIGMPVAVSPLRRRLELAQLVARLIERQPDIAPRAALYDLADSLAELLEEMQTEGVDPARVVGLDVSNHSAHWKRTQDFLSIVMPFFAGRDGLDEAARQRVAVERLVEAWRQAPPAHPVIVAGSTGSRGATAILMEAVARLPQGAVVLPGFDTAMPAPVWASLSDALTAEDHPQYRFRKLLAALGAGPEAVRPWHEGGEEKQGLNKLISLSLRPAPVTDQWLVEGPSLPDLVETCAPLSLLEAPDPGTEAMAIALILRRAAEEGRQAALISPDRMLTRRVSAALDRWGIVPDDSAGRPLDLSAPGRLLRQVARMAGRRATAEAVLALMKHPLVATGGDRGTHLRWTRDLELRLRRAGPAFPTGEAVRAWAAEGEADRQAWAGWIGALIDRIAAGGVRDLAAQVAGHREMAEALAAGPEVAGSGALWEREAGAAALERMEELAREADAGGVLGPADYADLVDALLARGEVREAVLADARIKILGPREARECRADLVILGGLNDGSWPQMPPPDPWLNRQMRQAAGLLLPDRQIGLSAHDYQMAVAAPEAILTRALRDSEAETVPSRWVNRLLNLMGGLPGRRGPEAVEAMRGRGRVWLELARRIDRPEAVVAPARRPAPRPPVGVRPRALAVTGIRTLIRDPYAIYARVILGLRPLDPLRAEPDARERGSVLHRILEEFVKCGLGDEVALLAIADTVLAEDVPWPTARVFWRARLERAAPAFLAREEASGGVPVILEERGSVTLDPPGFTLMAKPDRIDELEDGRLHILDYKTGAPPTAKQQAAFDKQLLLEAAMAERGGFAALGPREVARISYIGLGADAKVEATEITPEIMAEVWEGLHRLVARYMTHDQGYVARRAVFEARFPGDYDHLARFGEWDMTDPPNPEDVG